MALIFVVIVMIMESYYTESANAVPTLRDVSTCTYTFNVPRDSGSCLPGGQPTNDNLDRLQASLTNEHARIEDTLAAILDKLNNTIGTNGGHGNGLDQSINNEEVGTVYTRWGRTSCPATAEMLYHGYAAKAHAVHGGGTNYLCLPEDPEFPDGAGGGHQSLSYIYGVEYEKHNSPVIDAKFHNHDVPCAVCEVTGRSRLLMLPAKKTCPPNWTKEYEGLLMSQHHTHKGSDFVCVDNDMETLPGGSVSQDGGLLYAVEVRCGALKCPPYVQGYELTCTVCTK